MPCPRWKKVSVGTALVDGACLLGIALNPIGWVIGGVLIADELKKGRKRREQKIAQAHAEPGCGPP
jgi:hypothetical protein